MFGFIKKVFSTAMTFFSFNLLSVNSLKCISVKNQECKVREEVVNVNTNKPVEIVIMSMIHMLDYVFQMLLKT